MNPGGDAIKVLIAEDSALYAEVIAQILEWNGEIEVVGVASNGAEAVSMVERLRPDLVLMDVRMPVLDGLGAIEKIMESAPTPVLMMTADPDGQTGRLAFEALSRGALELVPKPESWSGTPDEQDDLRSRVLRLARVPVIRHIARSNQPWRARLAEPTAQLSPRSPTTTPKLDATLRGVAPLARRPLISVKGSALSIASSTGGPVALADLLSTLARPYPVPIVIAQHLSLGFEKQFASWLAGTTGHDVRVAIEGHLPVAGEVWIAPTHSHLTVAPTGRLAFVKGDPVGGHRPSADILLESVARCFGSRGVGVVLTGMGSDGALGLLSMRKRGATTFAQDEVSSTVFGMPKAAIDCGAANETLSLDDLGERLADFFDKPERALP